MGHEAMERKPACRHRREKEVTIHSEQRLTAKCATERGNHAFGQGDGRQAGTKEQMWRHASFLL